MNLRISQLFSGGRRRRPSLAVTTLAGERRVVALDAGRVSLGRSADNTISFPNDRSLSRSHLTFTERDGRYIVEDLASRNGTFVNGKTLEGSHDLRPGDVVLAGDVTVVFEVGASPEASVSFASSDNLSVPPSAEKTVLADILGPRTPGNAETLTEAAAEGRALWAFMRAGKELAVRRSMPELFNATLDLALEAVGAERGALLTLDEAGRLVVQAAKGGPLQVSRGLKDPVLKDKTSLLVRDAQALTEHRTIVEQGIHSLMVVPLQAEDRATGMIYIDSVQQTRRFTKEDLDLLTVMANVASLQIERERWALQRQLLVSENVERLRRLAAAVSHEFNTPLGALKSGIDSLLKTSARGRPASPEKQARLEAIQANLEKSLGAAVERMEQVIGRIQRFTNLDGGERRLIDIGEVLADAVALASEPSVEVVLQTEPMSPIQGDPQPLSATFLSLMSFAAELSKQTGAMRQVQVSTHVGDRNIEMRIDTPGASLSAEARGELFEPSFKVADGRVAAGNWSLFTAQQVIQGKGGMIEVSDSDNGLRLRVRLPTPS